MSDDSSGIPAVSIGNRAEGYPCPKDGATLQLIPADDTTPAGAWCPECHTVWREAGEVSLKDLDDLPTTEAR